jgi:hypothetical protein
MLLCGSDLLESFNRPGVWSEEDVNNPSLVLPKRMTAKISRTLSFFGQMRDIVGKYGVACLDRVGVDTQKTIADNDILFELQVLYLFFFLIVFFRFYFSYFFSSTAKHIYSATVYTK